MDREEMRFKAALECWKDGTSSEESAGRSRLFIEAFDKAGAGYVDPTKMQETIDAQVKAAVEKERVEIRGKLVAALREGISLGVSGSMETFKDPYRPGNILRFDPVAADRIVLGLLPISKEEPRG